MTAALVCIVVAGAVQAALPGDAFTLAWTHSVQKTRWEERYRVDGRLLHLVEARVEGSGAGMEPAADAVRDGAGWRWRPDRTLPALDLAASPLGGVYALCTAQRCATLPLPGAPPGPVTVLPCAAVAPR